MAARSVMSGRARRGLRRRWRRWRRRCDLLRWRRRRMRNGLQAPSTSIADAACLLPSVPCPVVAVAIALPAPDSVRRELTAMAHLMMRRNMRRRHRLRRRRRRGVRRSKKRHRDGAGRSNYETFLAVLHDVVPFFVVETGLFYHISARRARGGAAAGTATGGTFFGIICRIRDGSRKALWKPGTVAQPSKPECGPVP